jgi:hypothetical protein
MRKTQHSQARWADAASRTPAPARAGMRLPRHSGSRPAVRVRGHLKAAGAPALQPAEGGRAGTRGREGASHAACAPSRTPPGESPPNDEEPPNDPAALGAPHGAPRESELANPPPSSTVSGASEPSSAGGHASQLRWRDGAAGGSAVGGRSRGGASTGGGGAGSVACAAAVAAAAPAAASAAAPAAAPAVGARPELAWHTLLVESIIDGFTRPLRYLDEERAPAHAAHAPAADAYEPHAHAVPPTTDPARKDPPRLDCASSSSHGASSHRPSLGGAGVPN